MVDPMRCRCGGTRAKKWHLVCPPCWSKVPPVLQVEIMAAYAEKPGSDRHISAIRQIFKALGPVGLMNGLKPCPECDGEAEVYSIFYGRDHNDVRCKKCGFTTDLDDKESRVRKAWNALPRNGAKS